MKASILFFLAFVVAISVSAQKAVRFTPVNTAKLGVSYNEIIEQNSGNPLIRTDYHPGISKSTSTVSKVLFGSSRNIFTALVTEQNCMTYNKDLNAIMATSRGNDVGTILPFATGNDICTFWSTDNGNTFSSKLALTVSGNLFRYPSGVIFNPTGNTSVSTAFSVVGGPRTATAWDYTYLSSIRNNGTNFNVQQPATSSYKELVRNGMTSCTDGKVHIASMKYSADYTAAIGFVYNGTYSSSTNTFNWTPVDMPLTTMNVAPDGTLDAAFGYANMAWSKDGSIGYLMYKGVDNRSTTSKGYYPILYKSMNQGTTWQLMDYFDFSVFPEVFDHIWSTIADPNKAVPFFKEADIVVDAAGNPHIFGVCAGQYSQHPDSLGYTYLYEVPSVFEFSFENNQWQCHFIEHLKSRDVSAANSPYIYSPDNVGWDMRLQASRTDDGSKVFAVWTDTDWQFWSLTDSINLYPDVMMWGRDINTNAMTSVKNVTYLEEGMGEAYFMFVSATAKDNAGVYDIPLSIEDIYTTGLNANNPIYHYYLQGATFTDADFGVSPTTYVINTTSNPTIGGTTTGGGTFTPGQSCTVNAYTNTGYTFLNWTENGNVVSSSVSYTFTVTNSRTLTANFTQQLTYVISTASNPVAGGTTTGGGTFTSGQQCTVNATANAGYNFTNWTENGNVVSTSSSYSFTVSSNRSLVANFTQQQFIVTTTSNPTGGGTTTGSGTYTYGTNVTVTASANSTWTFTNWTENGNVVSTNSSYSFTLTTNRNLIANFSQQGVQYIVTANANPTTGGYTTGGGTYNAGTQATVNAFSNTGWAFINWTEYGSQVSTNPSYTFIVNSNHDFTANFLQQFIITATAYPVNAGYTTGGGSYTSGQTATLQAYANVGYAFYRWMENGNVVSSSPLYSFTVSGNRNLEARFLPNVEIDEQPSAGIAIYPNPANNLLTLQIIEGYNYTLESVELVNPTGKAILKINENLSSGKTIIDVSQIPDGLYFLKISLQNGIQKTFKVVIKR